MFDQPLSLVVNPPPAAVPGPLSLEQAGQGSLFQFEAAEQAEQLGEPRGRERAAQGAPAEEPPAQPDPSLPGVTLFRVVDADPSR
eukprot:11598713-Alexandrium_andersonii.AAC.1